MAAICIVEPKDRQFPIDRNRLAALVVEIKSTAETACGWLALFGENIVSPRDIHALWQLIFFFLEEGPRRILLVSLSILA